MLEKRFKNNQPQRSTTPTLKIQSDHKFIPKNTDHPSSKDKPIFNNHLSKKDLNTLNQTIPNNNLNNTTVSQASTINDQNNKDYITKRMQEIRKKYSFNGNNGVSKTQNGSKTLIERQMNLNSNNMIQNMYNQSSSKLNNNLKVNSLIQSNKSKCVIKETKLENNTVNQANKQDKTFVSNNITLANTNSMSYLNKLEKQSSKIKINKQISINPISNTTDLKNSSSNIPDPRIQSIDKINQKIKNILKNITKSDQQSKSNNLLNLTQSIENDNKNLDKNQKIPQTKKSCHNSQEIKIQKKSSICQQNKKKTNQKKLQQQQKQKRPISVKPLPIFNRSTFGKDLAQLRQKYSNKKNQTGLFSTQQPRRISQSNSQNLKIGTQLIDSKFEQKSKQKYSLIKSRPQSQHININALRIKYQKQQPTISIASKPKGGLSQNSSSNISSNIRPISQYQPCRTMKHVPSSQSLNKDTLTRQASQQDSIVIRRTPFLNDYCQIEPEQQYITLKPQTKRLLLHLRKQVELDQNYRNKKYSFRQLRDHKSSNHCQRLGSLLKKFKCLNINNFKNQQELFKEIQITQAQYNPFYTFRDEPSQEDLVFAYKKANQYWIQNIYNRFNSQQLVKKQNIRQEIILGYDKKGYLGVEDFVRMLNNNGLICGESGFYRNRDLILIFRRFCDGNISCSKLEFEKFISVLCGDKWKDKEQLQRRSNIKRDKQSGEDREVQKNI